MKACHLGSLTPNLVIMIRLGCRVGSLTPSLVKTKKWEWCYREVLQAPNRKGAIEGVLPTYGIYVRLYLKRKSNLVYTDQTRILLRTSHLT